MPQLDKVTFLSQFFWFCVIFYFLLSILETVFLPALVRVVRVRKALSKSGSESSEKMQGGTNHVYTESFDSSLSSFTAYADFLSRWNAQKLHQIVGAISPDFMNVYSSMRSENLVVEASINNVVPPFGRGQNLGFESQGHHTMFTSNICKAMNLKVRLANGAR